MNRTHLSSSRRTVVAAVGVVLSFALVAGVAPRAVSVQAGGAPTVSCALPIVIGRQVCYTPQQQQIVAARAPWTVNPGAAVKLTFGVNLSQVSATYGPPSASGTSRPTRVDYLYGPLKRDYGRQGSSPIALQITEYPRRANTSRFQPGLTHTVCGQKVEISQATLNHPYRAYGPWYLVGNFPHGNRSFSIVGNSGKLMLETLACRMMQNH